jgi:hypothetical protein
MAGVEMPPCGAEEVGTDEEEVETGNIETGDAETEGVETIDKEVETMEHLYATARVATLKHLQDTGGASGAVHKSEVETIDEPFKWGSIGDTEATKQPLPPSSFPCEWAAGSCTKTFSDKGQLLDHLRAVHHPKRAQCPACCKRFAYQCDVRRHYKRKHKDAPPLCLPIFPCVFVSSLKLISFLS